MTGNTDLQVVLNSMRISCDEVEYGFATIDEDVEVSTADMLGMFKESEGLTILATRQYLEDKGLSYEGPFAKLTVDIHTSLELVGLIAVLSTKLAESGISANVYAAFYHDHIFVQYDARGRLRR